MDDDLTGLDEALRGALGPESWLWPHDTAFDADTSRESVVHGIHGARRRRGRRLRAVTALGAVVVVVGLVLSQVVVPGAPPSGGHRGDHGAASNRPAAVMGPEGAAPSSSAECRPTGAATRPCGVLTATATTTAPAHPSTTFSTATGAKGAGATAAGSKAAGAKAAKTATPDASSHVLELGVGERAAVALPRTALWAQPAVTASSPTDRPGAVVSVHAPAATSTTAVYGWEHFVVEGVVAGAATLEVTGSCSKGTSCADGHTHFVLDVRVGAT